MPRKKRKKQQIRKLPIVSSEQIHMWIKNAHTEIHQHLTQMGYNVPSPGFKCCSPIYKNNQPKQFIEVSLTPSEANNKLTGLFHIIVNHNSHTFISNPNGSINTKSIADYINQLYIHQTNR